MNKQIRLFFILFGLLSSSIFNSKAEPDTFIDKIETPAEILSRCEPDIDTMNPDNCDTVKHILKVAVQAIDLGFKQLETSFNLLKKQPKPKQSILCSLKQLLKPSYEPPIGLSCGEISTCSSEANYKMNVLLLNQKIKDLMASLSKHDQKIVLNLYEYIIDKIRYHNQLSRYLYVHNICRIINN
jgi:hypothetical protein